MFGPRNNSHAVTRTMHNFRQPDCVVGAVVEQVMGNSSFKFSLLKMQKSVPLKRFIFTSKCAKMRLVADPQGGGSLQHSPRLPSWNKGKERGGAWERGGEENGQMRGKRE